MAAPTRRFTLQERQDLATHISKLDEGKLRYMLQLVRKLEPANVRMEGAEYAFDLARLDPATIRAVLAQLRVWEAEAMVTQAKAMRQAAIDKYQEMHGVAAAAAPPPTPASLLPMTPSVQFDEDVLLGNTPSQEFLDGLVGDAGLPSSPGLSLLNSPSGLSLGGLSLPDSASIDKALLPLSQSELEGLKTTFPIQKPEAVAEAMWSCPVCTFDNKIKEVNCGICGNAKPVLGSSTRPKAGAFKINVNVFEAKHRNARKMWECDTCGREFKARSDLVPHLRTHTGERPFKCQWPKCTSSFAHSSNLRAHERSHRGEKRYKCEECKKAFAHPSSLKDHKLSHRGIKPHACDYPGCGLAFTAKANMKRHRLLHDKYGGLLPRQRKKRRRLNAEKARSEAASPSGAV